MYNESDNLKQQGEIAAERGELEVAAEKFEQAMAEAVRDKDYNEAINIIGHRLHIHKKNFQVSGDLQFMENFYADVLEGLKLAEENNIIGQPKSVMQLRAGDYFLFKQEYEKAAENYRLACEELNKSGQQAAETNGEYKGHYAGALVKAAKTEQGFGEFEQALNLAANNHELRPFHHDIIYSGILIRQAESYLFTGQIEKAKQTLEKAKAIVDNLADEYKMPDRQIQWQELWQQV